VLPLAPALKEMGVISRVGDCMSLDAIQEKGLGGSTREIDFPVFGECLSEPLTTLALQVVQEGHSWVQGELVKNGEDV
jgi:hypothetical protein